MRVAFTASGKTPPQVIEGDDVGRVKAPAKARHGCNELRNWSAGVDDSGASRRFARGRPQRTGAYPIKFIGLMPPFFRVLILLTSSPTEPECGLLGDLSLALGSLYRGSGFGSTLGGAAGDH